MNILYRLIGATAIALALTGAATAADGPARVTIISDAFGKPSELARSWGYSALVEYGGRRILFDTGGQYEAFKRNVRALNIDLTKLDFVVLSDHGQTQGATFLQRNGYALDDLVRRSLAGGDVAGMLGGDENDSALSRAAREATGHPA